MKLNLHHSTTYRYGRAVGLRPHRMILRPRGSHELRVSRFSLRCRPDADLVWTQDVFGNLIATGAFTDMADELVIVAEAVVEQLAPEWPIFAIAPEAHHYPFAYAPEEVIDLEPLRKPGVAGFEDVEAWAQTFVTGPHTDTLSLLQIINGRLLDIIDYRVRDEEGTQGASETLALRSGSCRDIAALFIETARILGFGARAVSGYLSDPDLQTSNGGSTHAWAEIYLPGAGWIAFDPTHRRMGSGHLIPVAVGRCNAQIMPIVGGYVGRADDFVSMEVLVKVTAIPNAAG